MGIVLLNSSTHSLLRKILTEKRLSDKANYTNDQIIKLALEQLVKNKSNIGSG